MGTVLLVAIGVMMPNSWADERAAMAEAAQATPQLAALHAAYVSNPGDPEAATALGTAFMHSSEIPPRIKYKFALRLYRRALAKGAEIAEAEENSALIEGIYSQMGRPIPL